jgi:hypothetical protein
VINGSQDEIVRNHVTVNGVPKLIYVTNKSVYLGEISWVALTEEGLRHMASDFSAFVSEKTTGIVRPPHHLSG